MPPVPGPGGGSLANTGVIVDPGGTTIFTTGGSKDDLDIPNWRHTSGSVPDKDEITNAYAANYFSGGSQYVYYGGDRFANNGASTIGFWLFKNPVGPITSGPLAGTFSGVHAVGDLLIVSDFTTGGRISTIRLFKWVGTGGDATANGTLQTIPITTPPARIDCLDTSLPLGNICATVNNATETAPWSYTPKFGTAGTFPSGSFIEGSVDLTALGIGGCFSTFLAETRSSPSADSQLKDFVLGNFQVCHLTAPPQDLLSKVGDPVTYPLTVRNDGGLPLFMKDVSDTLLGNIVVNGVVQAPVSPVTSINATDCLSAAKNPLQPGVSCTIFVTRTVQATDPDPTLNTTTFVYNSQSGPGFGGDAVSTSVTSRVNLFQPSATMTVTASPAVAEVGDAITYTYTVNNTSSTDSPNLVLSSLTDTVLGNLTATASANGCGSLAPGASCTFGVSRTILATDPTPLTNSATVTFTLADPRFSNRITAPASASVIIVDAAISIAPTGVNAVGNPHTFTITVTAIPNGASPVSFGPITPSVSPAPGSMTSTCGAPTVAGNMATCTVTINNGTPDTFTANASAEVTMGGKSCPACRRRRPACPPPAAAPASRAAWRPAR
jgi:uncharacterized repeat protein (TIGR01451 family)